MEKTLKTVIQGVLMHRHVLFHAPEFSFQSTSVFILLTRGAQFPSQYVHTVHSASPTLKPCLPLKTRTLKSKEQICSYDKEPKKCKEQICSYDNAPFMLLIWMPLLQLQQV